MAEVKYHISPYPALHEAMVAMIWEAQSDGVGAQVDSLVIPERDGAGVPTPGAGHQVPYTVIFGGRDTVVHIVRLYSAISAILLHEYNAEATVDLIQAFKPIRFKIGDGQPTTPIAGSDTFVHPELVGLADDEYIVHRNGYGAMLPGVHYTINDIVGALVLIPPDVFGPDEEVTIEKQPKVITTAVNDTVIGKWVGGFVNIAADTLYSPTHLRKLIRFSGSCQYIFPALQMVPIGYGFIFQNFGHYAGAGGIGRIAFTNYPLKWGNGEKTFIDLPSFTEACFTFDGAFWNVVYASDSRWLDQGAVALPNTIIAADIKVIQWPGSSAGDIPAGSPSFEVVHNKAIDGNYIVLLSIMTIDVTFRENNDRTIGNWWHHATDKPNRFWIGLRELAPQPQKISVSWAIIKI